MSQFDAKIVYIKGEDNTVADALSHLQSPESCIPSPEMLTVAENSARHLYNFCGDDDNETVVASIISPCLWGPWKAATHLSSCVAFLPSVCTTLEITANKVFLDTIRSGYKEDVWCKTLPTAFVSWSDLNFCDGLWYPSNQLIIPRTGNL